MARTSQRSAPRGRGQPAPKRHSSWILPLIIGGLALLAFGGWYAIAGMETAAEEPHTHGAGAATVDHVHGQGDVELPHIHGMGFAADGQKLFVAAHDGLRVFADGEWLVPNLPVNDYMGYAPTDNGFYSSGHPGPGSKLVNPLGLVKSTDAGKTLTTLGFAGESDFHLMAAGYKNHAVYVVNHAPNSQLQTGLYYSLDDGKTWNQSTAQGLTAQPLQIAVHPTDANLVAVATEGGLFLSSNHGDTFERIGEAQPVTAVSFAPGGEKLYFGSNTLSEYAVGSKQTSPLATPPIAAKDAIGYVAVNPAESGEIAIATFGRDIFLSKDGGQTWQQIATNGNAS